MGMTLLDPTGERSPVGRPVAERLDTLEGKVIGLLDIRKARGDVFLDRLEALLGERGIAAKRYRKPTNTRVAPTALAQQIAAECGVVVEALSD